MDVIALLIVFGVLLIAHGAAQAWLPQDRNDFPQSDHAAKHLLRIIVYLLRLRGNDPDDLLYS